jgi:type III secretory pathway component EscS
MTRATAGTWGREPFHLIILYIAAYVAVAALAGLVLGLVLAAAALLAIHLQP